MSHARVHLFCNLKNENEKNLCLSLLLGVHGEGFGLLVLLLLKLYFCKIKRQVVPFIVSM